MANEKAIKALEKRLSGRMPASLRRANESRYSALTGKRFGQSESEKKVSEPVKVLVKKATQLPKSMRKVFETHPEIIGCEIIATGAKGKILVADVKAALKVIEAHQVDLHTADQEEKQVEVMVTEKEE